MQNEPTKPERLWKYREWNEYAERMIVKGEVHFTPLEDLNDPFDLVWCDRWPVDPNERDLFAKELCRKVFPHDTLEERRGHYSSVLNQVRRLAKDSRAGVALTTSKIIHGVFCASEINDDVLMWSHYAEHHKGVCIGIRTAKLTKKRFLPVMYTDRRPVLDCWGYVFGGRDAFIDASRTKGTHWKYEREWRAVDLRGQKLYPGCVDSVVIGARADRKTRNAVLDAVAASQQKIVVYESRENTTRYKLDIVPVAKPWMARYQPSTRPVGAC